MTNWKLENSYAALPPLFFTSQNPTPVPSPRYVVFNESLATELGFDTREMLSDDGVQVLAGNRLPPGGNPIAQAYAGHQFGHFTMLGDGRAILLGEQITPDGRRFDIQLKGAGPTPYSRRGDGMAALGPMLREYVISEAMHALGIPTTRSLAVVATGATVWRETPLPGAVLIRVAASHLRVGTFQFAAQHGHVSDLKALADYAINRHYPEYAALANPYLGLLRTAIGRQATLIALWQSVGFVHGVMNTDNMAISGETIDYGPCAFMDAYDPKTKFSSIDQHGRYAYGNQPGIALWNLARFAETLLALLHSDHTQAAGLAQAELNLGTELFAAEWQRAFRTKLGLDNVEQDDEFLIKELLALMEATDADFTNTFRALGSKALAATPVAQDERFPSWQSRYQARLARQTGGAERAREIRRLANPQVIPRNHRVEEVLLAAEAGDLGPFEQFMKALAQPYTATPHCEFYAAPSGKPYRTFCGT